MPAPRSRDRGRRRVTRCRKCGLRPARPRAGRHGPHPVLCESCELPSNRRQRLGLVAPRRRRPRPVETDPPLTAAQRDYLAAFDRFLRGEPGAGADKARALTAVLDEAQLPRDARERRRRFHRESGAWGRSLQRGPTVTRAQSAFLSPAGAKTAERGYGSRHQRLRRRWAPRVARGEVACARCGQPITPGEPWDLGHDDHDRTRYTGPEHRRCNRATAARRRPARRPRSRRW
jgi:hypothetical protein